MKISVVVPVYNEEKNISPFIGRVEKLFEKINEKTIIDYDYDYDYDYEIIFSLDPCTDRTKEFILAYREKNPRVKLITFSRRFGQPTATLAGLHYARGDASVVIDVDLQDPPELIEEMMEKWQEGYKVVYAQRKNRAGETVVKKLVSYFGYWIINRISDVNIPRNTGDFRLMDKKVVEKLFQFKGSDVFLRGLIAYIGFSQCGVLYDRDSRFAGKGNYNRYFGSLNIGLNGIFNFSKYPLHLISILGMSISALSFLLGLIYLFLKLINYPIIWGNPTLVILISFLSGIQLLSLGLMGQYMGRVYDAILSRPQYVVDELYGINEIKNGEK